MREFIRLQLKLKWGLNRNNSKKNAIMTAVSASIAALIALALVWGLTYVLGANIDFSPKQLSVFFLTIVMIGLTFVAIGMQINRLYSPGDLKITARFPISPFKIFVSYLILNYIDLMVYSAIVLLPMMLVFGWAIGCISFTFFIGIVLSIVVFPIIPFGISIIIAIPVMQIRSLLKKHNVVKLIFFILALIAVFSAYYYVLTVLAKFFIHRNWEEGTLGVWSGLIGGLNILYNPATQISNIMFFENFWLGLAILLGSGFVLISIGVVIAKFVYSKVRTRELEGFGGVNSRITKLDNLSSSKAIFKHSFFEILHTNSYSYFYLGVAISTPVMVFFCNRLVTMVGEASIGKGINFGAAMLVTAVFMVLISSFSASVLSVEGKNFYITKIIPVSFRKQLLVKGILYVAVSLVALTISDIVMIALEFVSAAEIAVLTAGQALFVVGLVFNGFNLNLVNPNLKPKANGEAEEINLTFMLFIGLFISAIFGMICIILPKVSIQIEIVYILIISLCAVYALINLFVFWFTANKKYKNIEV